MFVIDWKLVHLHLTGFPFTILSTPNSTFSWAESKILGVTVKVMMSLKEKGTL